MRFKLQLGAILLKLNEHNLNTSNIKDDITKINSDIEKINKKDTIKHNYSIENIWFFNIDILYDYILSKSNPSVVLYEYEIESNFTVNSILEINCNILYRHSNYNDIGLLRHNYSMPKTSCSNALEGLLHRGCSLSLPGPVWLNFHINFVVHLLL